MQQQTYRPRTWDDVKPYDTIVYNAERDASRPARLRYMVVTYIPAPEYRSESGTEFIVGRMRTKSGEIHRGYSRRFDQNVSVNIAQIVSVTGFRNWVVDVEEAHAEALDYVAAAAAAVEVHDAAFGPAAVEPSAPLIKIGDRVQRRGEEGPHAPIGEVTEVGDIAGMQAARVRFGSLPPIAIACAGLVKLAPCLIGHVAPTTDGGTCAECEQPTPAEPEAKRDVHTAHCCKRHGCKYGYGDPAREAQCTVASGKAPQEHPCEWCEDDPEPSEVVAAALADLAELRRETFRLWSAGTISRRIGLERLDRIERALRGGA